MPDKVDAVLDIKGDALTSNKTEHFSYIVEYIGEHVAMHQKKVRL